MAPLCWRNTIFPSAKAFASFAFQWNQQIGPFYCDRQKSRHFPCYRLIKFHKLGVLGSMKGMFFPWFPKITWTNLPVLCARIHLESVRNVSITTAPWKKSHPSLRPKGLQPAYNLVQAGSRSFCLTPISSLLLLCHLVLGHWDIQGCELTLAKVLPAPYCSSSSSLRAGITEEPLSKAPCLRCGTWRTSLRLFLASSIALVLGIESKLQK